MARNKNLELFKVKKFLINSAMKDFKTMFFKIVWKQRMHKSLALRSKFHSEAATQRFGSRKMSVELYILY